MTGVQTCALPILITKGVYEDNGELIAGVCGVVKEDTENMIISIEPSVSVPVEFKEGDKIFGKIQSVRDSMVSVEVLKVKGIKRSIGNYTVGTLHIAKMSKEFVSNIRELYQVNDLIQATVIKAKPAIELTTSHDDDGVVYAKCDVTHEDLKIVEIGRAHV